MRTAGFTIAALLVGAAAVNGQQPAPPAAQPPQPKADPKLDAHLAAWEKKLTGTNNFRFELELKRTDVAFKQDKVYKGVILCMKPTYAVLRLNYAGDKTGADYEAVICDGKSVYAYNGLEKTVTRWPLPENPRGGGTTDNLMVDLLSGMKAGEAKQRFNITLYKEDANYVYLNVLPVLGKDKAEFQQLRMALFGPSTKWPYLPAMVYMVKPNGDTEQWTFSNPQTNIPGLTPKNFAYQEVKGFRKVEGQPPTPPGPAGRPGQPKLPGGNNLPAGPGAVRPNR